MNIIVDETGKCNNLNNILLTDSIEKDIYEKLYYLYEYSDEIIHISSNPIFPSILNYVKTGILTEEEMIQALMYK